MGCYVFWNIHKKRRGLMGFDLGVLGYCRMLCKWKGFFDIHCKERKLIGFVEEECLVGKIWMGLMEEGKRWKGGMLLIGRGR